MRKEIALGVVALIVIAVIGGFWRPSRADDTTSPRDEPLEQAEQAIDHLRHDDVEGMMKLLKDQLVRALPDFDQTREMCDTHRRLHAQRHGKSLGESFTRFTFLERCERHAIVWRLGYYRTPDGWKLNEFEWDDKPAALYRAVR
jgi:hypothetical protein